MNSDKEMLPRSPQGDADNDTDSLDELIVEYVERLTAGETLNLDEITARHPDLANELVAHLRSYVEFTIDHSDTPLGTLGDYTLRRQIGRGGMGVVYDAWENSMDRQVALKVLPAGIAADDRAFQRFMREAKTAGRLSHPNIVPVYFTGVKEQTPFYAMEYVQGETLAQIIGKLREVEPEVETVFGKKDCVEYFAKLADAFADVADGLQHAHSKRVIHRDIKPSNLILDGEGRLRILDFGLARLEDQESLTASGDFVGTPLYMSPEQARQRKIEVDHRTDVYSLGATMYEVLTGQPPFRGKNHADTLSQIVERDPVEPRKLNHRVPKDLETIVLKCLRKDAGDRYGTAEALAQDLRRFVRGVAIEAKPQSACYALFKRIWRQRSRIAIALIIFLLAATTGVLFLASRKKARQNTLKLEPGSAEAHRATGWRYFMRADYAKALDRLRKAAELDPSAETLYLLGYTHWRLNNGKAAVQVLNRALQAQSDHYSVHVLLARIYRAQGDIRQAVRWFTKAIQLRPERTALHVELVATLRRREKPRLGGELQRLVQVVMQIFEGMDSNKVDERLSRPLKLLEYALWYDVGERSVDRHTVEAALNCVRQFSPADPATDARIAKLVRAYRRGDQTEP